MQVGELGSVCVCVCVSKLAKGSEAIKKAMHPPKFLWLTKYRPLFLSHLSVQAQHFKLVGSSAPQ